MDILFWKKMALAGDNPEEAYLWLLNQGYQDFAMVANRIRQVKNEIDDNNLDLHRMSEVR